jgi:predicted RNA-binding protein
MPKFYKEKEEKIVNTKINPHIWILVGNEENWETALQDSIWGARKNLKNRWDKLEKGDILVFYVSRPISGVIGFGRMETKFKQSIPLWKDEIRANKVIYPFRFEFKIDYSLPPSDWRDRCINIADLHISTWAGINSLPSKEKFNKLMEKSDDQWNFSYRKIILKEEKEVEKPVSKLTHKELQEMFKEIGSLQRFITETEYSMENEKLDIVWRKVEKSVPTYVFEVQIGGDIYHALGKLKHAWDIWNSNLFLIIEKEKIQEAHKLLGGTFHEIRDKIQVIDIEGAKELYQSKNRVKELEKKFGIIG